MIAQLDASIPPSEIEYDAAGIYEPVHDGESVEIRAAEIVDGGTAGYLEVHLSADPADQWKKIKMTADGEPNGKFVFDKIRNTNTTVLLSELTLYPLK
jgi:hypothetical protein